MLLPNEHHSLITSEMVKDICKPLFAATDINYFHYTKIYDSGKICVLITNPEFHYHFWQQGYEKELFKQYYEGVFFNEPGSTHILREGIQFNIDHLLMIITRYSNYYEVFGFGTTPGNDTILNFYLNHMDILKKFMLYFKEQGEGLIATSSKNLLPIPGYSIKEMKDFIEKKDSNDYFSFSPKKFHLHTGKGEASVTPKEFEVLRLMAHGYSGKEMANSLQVVLKTIETHVLHIKQKLGYTRRSDLVKCFLDSPYAEIEEHVVF